MSDQPSDIGSFFDKIDSKKKKQQTQQQLQAKKAEEQRKKQEEEKKLQSTSSSKGQNAAAASGDFESSDEEENRGKIDIVGGGVKDIKQVKKEKQQQDKLKESDNQGWNLGGPSQSSHANAEAKANQELKDKNGFTKGANIWLKPSQTAPQGQKEGSIQFKGKPSFKKSEQVAKQGEFPELGDEQKQAQQQTKANVGGPIGQMSAPAKNTLRTQNKFEGLQEETKEKLEPTSSNETGIVFKGEKPKFSGFKGFLSKQNEENAEANKGLSDLQKKLEEKIKIHDAKPAPRKEGEQVPQNGEEVKKPTFHNERREGGERKPRTFEAPKEAQEDSDDGFEQIDDKRRGGEGRKGGRGGRGGRGGFHKGEGEEQPQTRGGPRTNKDDAQKATAPIQNAKPAAEPKKEEPVKVVIPNQKFNGWGDAPLF